MKTRQIWMAGGLLIATTAFAQVNDRRADQQDRIVSGVQSGQLTAGETRSLEGQDANVAHYGNNEVGQRRQNQQDRLAQGIRSGRLNAGQTAHLEKREQGINQRVSADRRANGGNLTSQERGQINRAQNRTSHAIYRAKHA